MKKNGQGKMARQRTETGSDQSTDGWANMLQWIPAAWLNKRKRRRRRMLIVARSFHWMTTTATPQKEIWINNHCISLSTGRLLAGISRATGTVPVWPDFCLETRFNPFFDVHFWWGDVGCRFANGFRQKEEKRPLRALRRLRPDRGLCD